jgi:hypothetical protein
MFAQRTSTAVPSFMRTEGDAVGVGERRADSEGAAVPPLSSVLVAELAGLVDGSPSGPAGADEPSWSWREPPQPLPPPVEKPVSASTVTADTAANLSVRFHMYMPSL